MAVSLAGFVCIAFSRAWFGPRATLAIAAFAAASVFITFGFAYVAGRRAHVSIAAALRYAAIPSLFLFSGEAYFVTVESQAVRAAVAAAVSLLVVFYIVQLVRLETSEDNEPVCAPIIHAAMLFFAFAAVAAFSQYLPISLGVAAISLGVIAAVIALDLFASAGAPFGESLFGAAIALLLGAESYVALSYLPTAYEVNAAISVILLSFSFHVSRQAMIGRFQPLFVRRQMAYATILAVIVLSTARWA